MITSSPFGSDRARTLVLVGAVLGGVGCQRHPAADLVVFGPVWTADSTRPSAQAIAVLGDSIVAIGDSAMVAEWIGPRSERIDQPDGLVVPGFIDDHVHLFMGSQQLASVDLRDAASPAEFVRRVGAFAATQKPGDWIVGMSWDHELWGGSPLPDRSWIDSVTPNNPVYLLRLDGHMAIANSLALKAAGLDRSMKPIAGGEIVRRPDGELTGLLKDEAQNPVAAAIPPPSPSQLDSTLAAGLRHAASLGVTAVASVSTGWPEVAAIERARQRGALTMRVANYLPIAEWRSVAETLRVKGPGDDWVRVAGVKGLVDGSLGSTTALFDAPFTDQPHTSGLFTTPPDSMRRWIRSADSAGLQVVVHAIGDRANGFLLDAFAEVAQANGPKDRRFRIEHAQHLRPADLPRFATLGVFPSMQPYHAADDGRWAETRIGPERIKTTYPFRSLLDAKASLVFGSDWPVAPLSPFLGLEAAVTRQTIDGKQPEGFVPAEKISIEEALQAYTATNAASMYLDRTAGTLSVGRKADLVLLDRNLLTVPATSIDSVRVRLTMVGGRVVFRASTP
jgi:predicted amidohydrolase YtcJ